MSRTWTGSRLEDSGSLRRPDVRFIDPTRQAIKVLRPVRLKADRAWFRAFARIFIQGSGSKESPGHRADTVGVGESGQIPKTTRHFPEQNCLGGSGD